jgi:peptide/nickel transport system permease protein
VLGLTITLLVVLAAILAPSIAVQDPTKVDLALRLKPPGWSANGLSSFPFGTDQLGRDVLGRVLFGARISLTVGFTSVAVSGILGTLLGLYAGYYRGPLDQIIMRLADIQMAFPFIVLTIAVIAVLGPGLVNMVIVLALASWVTYARLVRAQTLAIREREFVLAARCVGCLDRRVILKHIFPNTLPAIIVIATYQVAQMIMAESALSFLGLGVQPPTPSWGSMISDGREYLELAWWISTFPGVALMLAVMGIGFLGDWLRERFDPRLRI